MSILNIQSLMILDILVLIEIKMLRQAQHDLSNTTVFLEINF